MDYRVFFKFSLFGLGAGLLAGIALPALAGAGEKTLRCNLRHACMNALECLNMGEDKPNTIDRLVIGPNGLGVLYSFWDAKNSATAILAYGTCWND